MPWRSVGVVSGHSKYGGTRYDLRDVGEGVSERVDESSAHEHREGAEDGSGDSSGQFAEIRSVEDEELRIQGSACSNDNKSLRNDLEETVEVVDINIAVHVRFAEAEIREEEHPNPENLAHDDDFDLDRFGFGDGGGAKGVDAIVGDDFELALLDFLHKRDHDRFREEEQRAVRPRGELILGDREDLVRDADALRVVFRFKVRHFAEIQFRTIAAAVECVWRGRDAERASATVWLRDDDEERGGKLQEWRETKPRSQHFQSADPIPKIIPPPPRSHGSGTFSIS